MTGNPSIQLWLAAALLSLIAAVALGLIARKLLEDQTLAQFHESQPCSGRKNEYFPRLRAALRSVTKTAQLVAEGYAKYGKANIPFLVPNIRHGPTLVIPPGLLKSVLSNPEHIVEAHEAQYQNVSAKYTMRDPNVFPTNYEVDLVRKQISKRYGSIAKELDEEVGVAFDEIWGTSKEWKELPAWDTLQTIAARAMNRVILGLPLCRDEIFLKRVISYAMSVQENGPAISLLPSIFQSVLGPLIAWKGTKDCEACIDVLQPLVAKRLAEFEYQAKERDGRINPPNDILQWLIEESLASNNPEQLQPRRLAHRIVMLNFNSVPPVGLTLAHTLFDLLSAPPSEGYVEALREESKKVYHETPERYWTKDAVSRLHLMDSTIRESMRTSDFGSLAFPRRVSAPNGIDVGGVHVPKGAWMQVPMHNIHIDDDHYLNAAKFEPFRFAGPFRPGSEKHDGDINDQKALVTLDSTFMTFGYLRNGCPGRFFASHMMKTMLAYILQHYDIEHFQHRPPITTIMEFRFTNRWAPVRIRRRT